MLLCPQAVDLFRASLTLLDERDEALERELAEMRESVRRGTEQADAACPSAPAQGQRWTRTTACRLLDLPYRSTWVYGMHMNVPINEQNLEHIRRKVGSGRYSSIDDVLDNALGNL